MRIATMADLVARWKEERFLGPKGPEPIMEALSKDEGEETPWYVKAFVVAGAWLASLFATIFLGMLLATCGIDDFVVAWLIIGLGAIGLALMLRRRFPESLFATQCAIAVSFAGQIAFTLGLARHLRLETWMFLLMAALFTTILYHPFDDPIHRFVGVAGTLLFLSHFLHHDLKLPYALHGLVGVTAWAAGWLFTRCECLHRYRPPAYACAIASPALIWVILVDRKSLDTPVWPATPLLALGLVALYAWVAEAADGDRKALIPVVLATALLSVVSTPGVLVALALLAMGHGRRDRALLTMGILFLPLFMAQFYFEMKTSLLAKSGSLVATGLVLLGARAYLVAYRRKRDGARP